MNKKAIFLDIDNTLITGSYIPFKEDLDAMNEAAEKGHFLFLNSGRSFANIPSALLETPAIKGIAAGGGAHILMAASPARAGKRFRTIYHKWIPEDALEMIFSIYGKQKLYCYLEGERDCYTINGYSLFEEVKAPIPVRSFDEFKIKSRGDFITKLTVGANMPEEEGRLLESYLKINRFPDYSEGIIIGENKAKAMELILENLKLRREDSIAIGDAINDLDMIRFAGLGIAMGNACPELRAAAGAVTGRCGKGGVAQALKKFVL